MRAASRPASGSPLVLSRLHWVWSEFAAELKFVSWTEDNPRRQVVYEGLREDKPAPEAQQKIPHPKPASGEATTPTSFRSSRGGG
jgi:hypothetical protein